MLADFEEVQGIDKLKIIKFKGLSDLAELEFSLMNVIVSPGNFGKTTLLMAVAMATDFNKQNRVVRVAEAFRGRNEKLFEKILHILYDKDGEFIYELQSEFGGFILHKSLIGIFSKNKFCGEYFSHLKNEELCIDNNYKADLTVSRGAKEIDSKNGIAGYDFAYFDFSGEYRYKILEYKNDVMRKIIEDYILSFEDFVDEIYIKNGKHYIKHLKLGECTAEILGSSLVKCLEFSDFCDKNQKKVLLIDNLDSNVSPDVYRIFIKMLLAHLVNTGSQFFVTAKDRKFGELLIEEVKSADLYRYTSFIDIYRDDNGIGIKNILGKDF